MWKVLLNGCLLYTSALLIGTIAGFYGRKLSFLPGLLFGEKKSEEEKEQTEPENGLVITIAREYGSGGHDIGKALAKELGIPLDVYKRQGQSCSPAELNIWYSSV